MRNWMQVWCKSLVVGSIFLFLKFQEVGQRIKKRTKVLVLKLKAKLTETGNTNHDLPSSSSRPKSPSKSTLKRITIERLKHNCSWLPAFICFLMLIYWATGREKHQQPLAVTQDMTPTFVASNHHVQEIKGCLNLHQNLFWISQEKLATDRNWTVMVAVFDNELEATALSIENVCGFIPLMYDGHRSDEDMFNFDKHKHPQNISDTPFSVVQNVDGTNLGFDKVVSSIPNWLLFTTPISSINFLVVTLHQRIEFTFTFATGFAHKKLLSIDFLGETYQTMNVLPKFTRKPCLVTLLDSGIQSHHSLDHLAASKRAEFKTNTIKVFLMHATEKAVFFSGWKGNRNILGTRYIPCTSTAIQIASQKQLNNNNNQEDAFDREATQIVKLAKQGLDSLGIRFWINSGTLLGWLRECSFIGHSKDVDIGVLASDFTPDSVDEMVSILAALGLRLSHRFGLLSDSFELSFQTTSGLKLDIFFFYKNDTNLNKRFFWNGGTQARTGRKFKYTFPVFKGLCWASLKGLYVRIPCNTETFVEANYGREWRTPVTEWDWKASPSNVNPNGVWNSQLWQQVIQCDVCKFKVDLKTPYDKIT